MALPATLPAVTPETLKSILPQLTVMLMNGAFNFLYAVLILIAGWLVARWVGRWVHSMLDRARHFDQTLKPLLAKLARYLILAITIVAVLGQFGVQTTSLIALVGATGLALGLALQGTLSNVASGVMLLVLRPFEVGERIETGGAAGIVREIGLFRSVLITDDGLFMSIPNATIFSGTILNTSREGTRRSFFTVDIDRGADIAAVQKAVLAAVAEAPLVLKSPAPAVAVESLSGPAVQLSVQAWFRNADFGAQSDLKARVRAALEAAGVSPPIPVLPPGNTLIVRQ